MIKTKKTKLTASLKKTSFDFNEKLAKKLAGDFKLPYLNITQKIVAPEILQLLTKEDMASGQCAAISKTNYELGLGVIRPNYPATVRISQKLRKQFPKSNLKIYLISENSLRHLLSIYKEKDLTSQKTKRPQITSQDLEKLKTLAKNTTNLKTLPSADVLENIIAVAAKLNASDIHFEISDEKILVRFRVDGVLTEIIQLPIETFNLIKARIKILTNLKLNITNVPQDGSFRLIINKQSLDFRVSALPGIHGENIVLRILSSDIGNLLKLENLGLTERDIKMVKQYLEIGNGSILLTGPTGSGKTTTLYTLLKYKTSPQIKIMTLEDPVEYSLPTINQISIDTDEGLTFSQALRGVLRQDPDIIMVGEIRDAETALTLVQAASTGPFVFSTLHANSAADIIFRFQDFALSNQKLAGTLKLLINQRLVRRLCQHCRQKIKLSPDKFQKIKASLGLKLPQKISTFKAVGCPECDQDGYKGRTGVFEIMAVDSFIADLIKSSASAMEIEQAAQKYQNMNTVLQAAYLKLLTGETTWEEIERVF